jgi:Flp pilus assembly pilin Flp
MKRIVNGLVRNYVRVLEASEGQGYVEYILIIAFVGLAVIAGLTLFAGGVNSALSQLGGQV